MPVLPINYRLKPGQRRDPVVWTKMAPEHALGRLRMVDTSDAAMQSYLGRGKAQKLKSFGHDQQTGVHFLLTRAGTAVHTDPAYARYSHQVILRNDGNRLRGLPMFDSPDDPDSWHPMLVPGMMYCLDTHSPHQGYPDARFPSNGAGLKAVIAFDRDRIIGPAETWEILAPWVGRQFSEVDYDPKAYAAPKWKDTTSA